MKDALIGYTGFVGSTLFKQKNFEGLYRSTNLHEIEGQTFDTIVCAGAPAQMWIANQDPEGDLQKIQGIIEHLKKVKCRRLILISTVAVFKHPIEVDESTPVEEEGQTPYGRHRRMLEKFVQAHFPDHLVARLSGLVGPGLKKNVIFDFLNTNNLQAIDSRSVYQFYPMVNLWYDLKIALDAGLKLVHLTGEPIVVNEVAEKGFGHSFTQVLDKPYPLYDMRTLYGALYESLLPYQYSRKETLQAIRAYAQSEPLTKKEG